MDGKEQVIKMNIVYFLTSYPELSESFILNEIYELDKKGHNIAVCALNKPNRSITHAEFNELDIPVSYIKKPSYTDVVELISAQAVHPKVLKGILYRTSPKYHAANLFRTKKCIQFINSLSWEPDHFHSHFASVAKFAALHVSDYYNTPFTITTHAYDLYKKPIPPYTNTLFHRADRIVTISEYNRRNIRNRFAPDTPIDIVRAGIRPEKFEPTGSTKPNRVLTISRFVEKKGLPYALKAVSIAAKRIPDIEYHIIGSGELEAQLVTMVNQLGIGKNVKFLDNVNDQRLITELDEARSFLLPSIIAESGDRDGIPVVLMEAMAMKTPPVSTTVSGIPELIDHEENGLLTEPRNPEGTADALVRLLQNDSEWHPYSEASREKVCAEFNIKTEANKLETVFKNARKNPEQ